MENKFKLLESEKQSNMSIDHSVTSQISDKSQTILSSAPPTADKYSTFAYTQESKDTHATKPSDLPSQSSPPLSTKSDLAPISSEISSSASAIDVLNSAVPLSPNLISIPSPTIKRPRENENDEKISEVPSDLPLSENVAISTNIALETNTDTEPASKRIKTDLSGENSEVSDAKSSNINVDLSSGAPDMQDLKSNMTIIYI